MSKDTKIGLSIVLGIFLIGIVLAAEEMRDSISYFFEQVIPYNLGYYAIGFLLLLLVVSLLPRKNVVDFLFWRNVKEKSGVEVEQPDLSEQKDSIFAKRKHSRFFKEIQSVLRNTLLPLGFNEKEKMEAGYRYKMPEKSVQFKLAEFTVFFWFNFKDSSYNLDIYHLLKDEDGQKNKTVQDHAITADISEGNQFKREVIEKLNDWIIKEGVKFRKPN